MNRGDLVERVARAFECGEAVLSYREATRLARAALAIIEPAVREECAQVASNAGIERWHGTMMEDACDEVAAAIRAGAKT